MKIQPSTLKFEKQKEISYTPVSTDFLFSYPVSLVITEDELIVQDERGHDYFFHVLDRSTWKLISEFAKKGNGPGEILYPSYSPYIHDNEFQIYDYHSNKLYYFTKNNDSYSFSRHKNIERDVVGNNSFIRQCIDVNNFHITMGENGIYMDKQITLLDEDIKVKERFLDYLILDDNKKVNDFLRKEMSNIYFLKISPDGSYMVFASYKMGIMDIFSLEKVPESVERIKTLLLTQPMTESNENIYGFEDVFVTDKYIYTLHNGMSANENALLTKSVKVFDKYGYPIVQYHVNMDMRCIAVDEKSKKAFAISYQEEDGFGLIELNDMFSHL
jgi:hypothetical protein